MAMLPGQVVDEALEGHGRHLNNSEYGCFHKLVVLLLGSSYEGSYYFPCYVGAPDFQKLPHMLWSHIPNMATVSNTSVIIRACTFVARWPFECIQRWSLLLLDSTSWNTCASFSTILDALAERTEMEVNLQQSIWDFTRMQLMNIQHLAGKVRADSILDTLSASYHQLPVSLVSLIWSGILWIRLMVAILHDLV